MKIEVDSQNYIVLKEIYTGIMLETSEGNRLGICMRDDTFEINVIPEGSIDRCWHRVNMKTKNITKCFIESGEAENIANDNNEMHSG